jgi:hypothetical protein
MCTEVACLAASVIAEPTLAASRAGRVGAAEVDGGVVAAAGVEAARWPARKSVGLVIVDHAVGKDLSPPPDTRRVIR